MVNILPKYAVGLLAALGQGGSWQQALWGSVSSERTLAQGSGSGTSPQVPERGKRKRKGSQLCSVALSEAFCSGVMEQKASSPPLPCPQPAFSLLAKESV